MSAAAVESSGASSASAGAGVSEDQRALFELDRHRAAIKSQVLSVRGQTQMKRKTKRRTELCLAEIETMPQETVTYKAVGRMFMLSPMPTVVEQLNALVKKTSEDLTQLEQQEKYLLKDSEATEKSIEELISKMNKE